MNFGNSLSSHSTTSRRRGRRRSPLGAESLEARTLFAAGLSVSLTDGELAIVGTSDSDRIVVRQMGERLWIEGESGVFKADEIRRIAIDGGAGNDRIFVAPSIVIPATIRGGEGDDRIASGGGDDLLLGGAGHDKVVGGAGDDKLNGGVGSDRLLGGAGHDVIFGGEGNDLLVGGFGTDRLSGDSGDDRLRANSSDALVDGGEGYDRWNTSPESYAILFDSITDEPATITGIEKTAPAQRPAPVSFGGADLDSTRQMLENYEFEVRVASRDGESFFLTMDFHPHRLNVSVTHGEIDSAHWG